MKVMRLRTLGTLALEESKFRRVKPLLLLAYLTVEGRKPRRYLAELFWPDASSAMNSLSVALSQLRRSDVPIEADDVRAWVDVASDVQDLKQALAQGALEAALACYQGPFLEGVDLELGVELEEWVFETRENLAAQTRTAALVQAGRDASQGRFSEAAKWAQRAFELPGGEPDPDALMRIHALLVAGDHPLAAEVFREAESYGVAVRLASDDARSKLQQTFIGRDSERQRLVGLAASEWAWLRGGTGMGKTMLLKSLEGTYLPARSGLPYATLEPLLGEHVEAGEERMLRTLLRLEGTLLFDDWERMDTDSQTLLTRLRGLRPALRVIITSKQAPAIDCEYAIDLAPLPAAALAIYPEAWEKTGGLPALVGAYLRQEPLEEALETRLSTLPVAAVEVYLALALLEKPDWALVRRALELDAATMSNVLEVLIAAGLVLPSGQVNARGAALEYLDGHPHKHAPLALKLARLLEPLAAFVFYARTQTLWESRDMAHIEASYLAWAEELLRRGVPQRAFEVLKDAPDAKAVVMLRARALERAGFYQEALQVLEPLGEAADVLALKSTVLWRLGQPEQAAKAANAALEGDIPVRAEALNTLGSLHFADGHYQDAISHFRRAATLWRALASDVRYVGALINIAIATTLLSEPTALEPATNPAAEVSANTATTVNTVNTGNTINTVNTVNVKTAFAEALQACGDQPLLKARVLLNTGWMTYVKEHDLAKAENLLQDAAHLAIEAGATDIAADAWNNLGAMYHKEGDLAKANTMYEKALANAQQMGERYLIGLILANLAELNEDQDAWEEALALLEASGHESEAALYREELPADHPFRLRSEG
jgi:tetratricopeptide (TPR) repeat protein